MAETVTIRVRVDTIQARQEAERFARFQREAGVATPIEAKLEGGILDRLSKAGLSQAEISPLRVAATGGLALIKKSSQALAKKSNLVKKGVVAAGRVAGFVKKADVFLQAVQGGTAVLGEFADKLTKNNEFINKMVNETINNPRFIDMAARIRSEATGLSQTIKQSFTIAEGLALAEIKLTPGQGSRIGQGLMAMNTATAREQAEFQAARTRLYTRGAMNGAMLIANSAKGMAKNLAERAVADTRALVSEFENTAIGRSIRKTVEKRNEAMMKAGVGQH